MFRKTKAFTVIELLSAMTMGLVCIFAVGTAFMHHRKNYQYQNALNALQENVRFAIIYFQDTIQSAEFVGCNNIKNIEIKNKGASRENVFDQQDAIKVYPAEEVPGVFDISAKENTDVIVVHRMDSMTANLKDAVDGGSQIMTDYNPEFLKDSDMIIADCEKAVLFHAETIYRSFVNDYQKITATNDLKSKFKPDAEVGNIRTFIFFIKPGDQDDTLDSLYVKNESDRADELISGLTDLKAEITGNKIKIDFSLQSKDQPQLKQNVDMIIPLKNL